MSNAKTQTTTANESLLMSSDCILNFRAVWQWDVHVTGRRKVSSEEDDDET